MLKVVTGLALVISIAWCIKAPGFDSAVSILGALAAFIGACYRDKKRENSRNQTQAVGAGGVGIQAGRNVSVGDIRANAKAKDAE